MTEPAATVEPTASAAAEPTEPAESKETNLDEHASLYGPQDPTLDGDAKKANDEARAKVRHRAKSQQASPEDAPRIQELTRKLREAEAKLAAQPAQTPPARADQPQGPAVAPAGATDTSRQAVTPQGVRFDQIDDETGLPIGWTPTRPEPSVEDVGTKYATYESFTRAQARWVHEQLDAVREAKQQIEQQTRQQSEAQQAWHKAHATYGERLKAFTAEHADFQTLIEQHGNVHIPAAPYQAILAAEAGPAWVYHLMQHPDQLAELALLFDGKAPTPEIVAHATRWLSSRAQPPAAPAPAPVIALAPKPPNPVRTGPAKTDNDGPSDDSMSIAEHEKAYGGRRRR